eukprot:8886732-Pyramimonas_sp.AAC.1
MGSSLSKLGQLVEDGLPAMFQRARGSMKLGDALVEERGVREKRWGREDIEVPDEEGGGQLRGRARDGQ